jgi:hypothetical protein
MKTVEVRKQISIFIPVSDWRAIRQEAARLGIPITELCRRWMSADMQRLREVPQDGEGSHAKPPRRWAAKGTQ